MPLYDYRCKKCNHVVEVRHGFNETYAEPCPVCGGALQRVFNPAPIVFKGSGFYVTDSRKSSAPAEKPAEPAKAETASKTEAVASPSTTTKPDVKKSDAKGEPAA
jgi:putative FmdB family regulatory protein